MSVSLEASKVDGTAEREARLAAIVASSPDAMVSYDLDGRIATWNHGAQCLFGYSEAEAVGQSNGMLVPPELRASEPLGVFPRALAGEVVQGLETVRLAKGDRRVEVVLSAARILCPDERVVGVSIIFRDITDRKRADAALAASQTRLQGLLAMLDLAAVFVRDFGGTIRFWSEGCERLYGWTRSEAVGRISHELLQTVFTVPPAEIEATLLRDGEWSGDLQHRRRDGALITVAVRKALRRRAEGRPAAIMESVADVTALRQAQSELGRLNQELEARVLEEVAAREAVQSRLNQAEKLTALGQLAGGIAHDFNNVLQAIAGGISLIRRRAEDSAAVRRLARMVEEATERGASVTRRLLAFARRGELCPEPVDLAELVKGLREVLGHTLGASVSVQTAVPAGLPPVLADRGQLETALVNLATNARDAMPTGGTLTFSARLEVVADSGHPERLASGAYLCLCIADTGTGMDKATLARALEPFFSTKEPGKGTGLGLPIARSFAEQSGGALAVASTPGRGTTVRLWLPVAAGAVEKARPEQPVRPALTGTRRVLLVDDEPLVREVLAEELANSGYEVVQAERGSEALALVRQGAPVDVLISDLSMPDMDGMAVIRAAHECRPLLPAILLTGFAGDLAALSATGIVNGGRFALVRKPVAGGELADRVATLLAADGSGPERVEEPSPSLAPAAAG